MIKETTIDHLNPLLAVLKKSGQFDEGGIQGIKRELEQYFEDPGAALWFTVAQQDGPVGLAHCVPEPDAVGTWVLGMLWIKDDCDEMEIGPELVARIERELLEIGARLLIVETSGSEEFEFARLLYEGMGFVLEARVKDFYDVDEDKVIYSRLIRKG